VEGNTLKVGDFALARLVPRTVSDAVPHEDEPLADFAAPELFQGRVTPWTDQFSLAITYVVLRMGRSPFRSSSPSQLRRFQEQAKVDLKGLARSERLIIAKATEFKPENRFKSCTELAQALDEVSSVILLPRHRAPSRAEPQKGESPGPSGSAPRGSRWAEWALSVLRVGLLVLATPVRGPFGAVRRLFSRPGTGNQSPSLGGGTEGIMQTGSTFLSSEDGIHD
jgi:hypothetical protein